MRKAAAIVLFVVTVQLFTLTALSFYTTEYPEVTDAKLVTKYQRTQPVEERWVYVQGARLEPDSWVAGYAWIPNKGEVETALEKWGGLSIDIEDVKFWEVDYASVDILAFEAKVFAAERWRSDGTNYVLVNILPGVKGHSYSDGVTLPFSANSDSYKAPVSILFNETFPVLGFVTISFHVRVFDKIPEQEPYQDIELTTRPVVRHLFGDEEIPSMSYYDEKIHYHNGGTSGVLILLTALFSIATGLCCFQKKEGT